MRLPQWLAPMLAALALSACATTLGFSDMFSLPVEPNTLLGRGQFFEIAVPAGRRAVITDVYIHNQGGLFGQPAGTALVHICEMRLPNSCEIRYSYQTTSGQVLVVNYSTGVRLGDAAPISAIRILNDSGSITSVHPRVNGYFVP